MDEAAEKQPPAGFAPFSRIAPVLAPWTPLYERVEGDLLVLGAFVLPAHCNNRALLHGGVISTLADIAMGMSLALARRRLFEDQNPGLTTSLTIDYIASGAIGQWLEVRPRIVHAGRASGVTDALITADGKTIARAAASFRVRS